MDSALCYDSENKRLYKGVAGTKDCLISKHDKKGYKTYKYSIPDEPVEIVISSNLHYQGASFLYAKILIKGKSMLNFQDIQALHLMNHCSLDTFQVEAGNWDELFDIIIKNYNNLYFTSEGDVENYLNELDKIVLCENISVFRNKSSQAPTEWKGTFLVLLHSINRLSNIIECKYNSVIDGNTYFQKRLLSSCRNYLQRFTDCYPTWERMEGDPRLKHFSEKLLTVCEYIEKNGNPFEIVDLLTTNRIKQSSNNQQSLKTDALTV